MGELQKKTVNMFEIISFLFVCFSRECSDGLQYLSVFDHILQHRDASLMPRPPCEFIVVSLACARLAEDDGSFCRQDLSWQL